MRIFKLLIVVILAMLIGLVAYAYLGDMESERQEVRIPIDTGIDTGDGVGQ